MKKKNLHIATADVVTKNGTVFSKEALASLVGKQAPLTFEFDSTNKIGKAKIISFKKGVLYAEISLKKGFPGLYPALGGFLKGRRESDTQPEVITECELSEVSLVSRHADPTVPPIK